MYALIHSDAPWWHWSGSTLAQLMACCLTTPSHYLNHWWCISSEAQWHLVEGNFIENVRDIIHWNLSENYTMSYEKPLHLPELNVSIRYKKYGIISLVTFSNPYMLANKCNVHNTSFFQLKRHQPREQLSFNPAWREATHWLLTVIFPWRSGCNLK